MSVFMEIISICNPLKTHPSSMRVLHVFIHDGINDNNIDKAKLKKTKGEKFILLLSFFFSFYYI